MNARIVLFGLFILCTTLVNAQKGDTLFTTAEDSLLLAEIPEAPDSAFALAREYAFDAKYKKAEKILQYNVQRFPENTDYSIFLARVYSWQKEYDKSRDLLNPILKEDTAQMEAYRLLTLVERYDKKFDTSLVMSNKGLKWYPKDEFFYVNKAQNQTGLIKYEDALETVDSALISYPNNTELKQLRVFLSNQLIASGLSIGFGLDYFTENAYATWYSGLIQYGIFTSVGPIIPRINIANRFEQTGVQFEIDAYPQLGNGRYLYLNAGYSESVIFPEFRFGGEFYSGIPNTSFEASIGLRYLYFGVDNSVTLYTGSLGWYYGNSFWQFRPFFIDQEPTWGVSYNLMYRRFLEKGGFIQASAGIGYVPDLRFIQIGTQTTEQQYYLENQTVGLAYQAPLGKTAYLRLDVTFANQERFRTDTYYNIYSGFLTVGVRF